MADKNQVKGYTAEIQEETAKINRIGVLYYRSLEDVKISLKDAFYLTQIFFKHNGHKVFYKATIKTAFGGRTQSFVALKWFTLNVVFLV